MLNTAATKFVPPAFETGTIVATVGTFYEGEVIKSEVRETRIGWVRTTTIRWTQSVPLAQVFQGQEMTYSETARTPWLVKVANQG